MKSEDDKSTAMVRRRRTEEAGVGVSVATVKEIALCRSPKRQKVQEKKEEKVEEKVKTETESQPLLLRPQEQTKEQDEHPDVCLRLRFKWQRDTAYTKDDSDGHSEDDSKSDMFFSSDTEDANEDQHHHHYHNRWPVHNPLGSVSPGSPVSPVRKVDKFLLNFSVFNEDDYNHDDEHDHMLAVISTLQHLPGVAWLDHTRSKQRQQHPKSEVSLQEPLPVPVPEPQRLPDSDPFSATTTTTTTKMTATAPSPPLLQHPLALYIPRS